MHHHPGQAVARRSAHHALPLERTAYKSKHHDVAAVIVTKTVSIVIERQNDNGMNYFYGTTMERPLHETEGFTSREAMDDWFRPLVKRGKMVTKHLMLFRLATPNPQQPPTQPTPTHHA